MSCSHLTYVVVAIVAMSLSLLLGVVVRHLVPPQPLEAAPDIKDEPPWGVPLGAPAIYALLPGYVVVHQWLWCMGRIVEVPGLGIEVMG
jgi:hypothetical protein